MERWQRIPKPPGRRGCDYPSFSSTLLDSIYQSIDDEATTDGGATDPCLPTKKKQAHAWSPPALTKARPPRGAPDHHLKKHAPAVTRQRHFPSSTSTSSDCSRTGGFSSSEPEPAPVRLKPIRTGNFPPRSDPPPPVPEKKKKNLNSICSKFRDLKKSRSPMSPAAKLASFLNSLFTPTAGNGRKHKAAAAGEESACSTASSYSRSCLVKTPSTSDHGVKRSVRFALPADGGNARWRENRHARRGTMTWRDLEAEDDDGASDSSSDLFELEDLAAVGRYRDELPVYETTLLGGLIL